MLRTEVTENIIVARVLIIEDDVSNQMVMRKALMKLGGFQVTTTEDVSSILALTHAGQVDVIVMDVSLANSQYEGEYMDGLAITRLLKTNPRTATIPVLLATAHAMAGDADRLCAVCGADAYLSKPFAEPRALVNKVRSLLNR